METFPIEIERATVGVPIKHLAFGLERSYFKPPIPGSSDTIRQEKRKTTNCSYTYF